MMTSDELNTPALNVAGLSFSYPDRTDVLHNLNFTIRSRERVGLIGPNGCGKTTLFLAICGILKPAGGAVDVLGKTVRNGDFLADVGLVFQNPDDQLFCPSVREDVAFGPQNMRLPKTEIDRRVTAALTAVDTLELAERPAHHLSGGEKRMVSIATVLAMQPRLILYDEPSANLDIRSRRRLIHLLQASDETIMVASHDLELVLEICDRVLLMDNGRIVADGNAREVMSNADLMEAHGQEKPHSLMYHAAQHHTPPHSRQD
jgi:cobalt/nickel transport system ATP-binding protein